MQEYYEIEGYYDDQWKKWGGGPNLITLIEAIKAARQLHGYVADEALRVAGVRIVRCTVERTVI